MLYIYKKYNAVGNNIINTFNSMLGIHNFAFDFSAKPRINLVENIRVKYNSILLNFVCIIKNEFD
jgi:hypothetical protein